MPQTAAQNVELAQRIAAGDKLAEEQLVARFQTPIRLIIFKRTGNAQLAKDICQEAFIAVLENMRMGKVRNPESLSAYIRQVALHLSVQHYRKEKRFVSEDDVVVDLHAQHRDRKDASVDAQNIRCLLNSTLNDLAKPRDREILQRFYLHDEDKAQICDALSLTPAHFDRVLYRAKQRMRKLIEEQDGLKALLFGGLLNG